MRALLKADLAQAAPRRVRAPTGRPLPRALMGQEQPGDPILTLVRNGWSNPGQAPRASLQRVEYRVVEGRLERRVFPYLDGARPGPPQVLCRGVKDAAVTFIQDGSEAQAFITSSDRPLPDAVRIVMTLDGVGRLEQLFLVASA
jgi:general secretion pathway protein J